MNREGRPRPGFPSGASSPLRCPLGGEAWGRDAVYDYPASGQVMLHGLASLGDLRDAVQDYQAPGRVLLHGAALGRGCAPSTRVQVSAHPGARPPPSWAREGGRSPSFCSAAAHEGAEPPPPCGPRAVSAIREGTGCTTRSRPPDRSRPVAGRERPRRRSRPDLPHRGGSCGRTARPLRRRRR